MHTAAQSLIRGALHLLLPRLCEGCRQPLLPAETVLCFGCGAGLPRTDLSAPEEATDAALRLSGRVPFKQAAAYVHFAEGSLTQYLLHRLKYRAKPEIGRGLGRMFGKSLSVQPWPAQIDCAVPVPLHYKRERQRGYNQSALLAEGISSVLGISHFPHALRRTRATESQTRKTRAERVENVAGAFAVRSPEALRGAHVLLVDDVLTTGATLEACAAALLALPGTAVSVAVFAIA